MLTISIQNSTYDTNVWFVVDFCVTKGMVFSSKCTIMQSALPGPAGELPALPEPLAGYYTAYIHVLPSA